MANFVTSLPGVLLAGDHLERQRRANVALLRAQVTALRRKDETAVEQLAASLAEDPNNLRALDLRRALREATPLP